MTQEVTISNYPVSKPYIVVGQYTSVYHINKLERFDTFFEAQECAKERTKKALAAVYYVQFEND